MILRSDLVHVPIDPSSGGLAAVSNHLASDWPKQRAPIRWGVVGQDDRGLSVEICSVEGAAAPPATVLRGSAPAQPVAAAALVIPTGVGARTGGFIGDASPCVRVLETVADWVIVHPNVVNGADFYGGGGKALYVDGLTLDRFFGGELNLGSPRMRRIGLVLDQLESSVRDTTLNAANACCAIWGVDVLGYVVCDEPVRARVRKSPIGYYTGQVDNPETLLSAAQVLQESGADAIAVVTAIGTVPGEVWRAHYCDGGPNPIGTLEAMISRAITWHTGLPCAHAPAFEALTGSAEGVVDPRAAGEVASGSGLPCILRGLSGAPDVVKSGGLSVGQLAAVIVPHSCAGGPPALAAIRNDLPLVTVRSNKCLVQVEPGRLGLSGAVEVANYAEAVAFVAAQRAGVSFERLRTPARPIEQIVVESPRRVRESSSHAS
jgi:hypothetical protein